METFLPRCGRLLRKCFSSGKAAPRTREVQRLNKRNASRQLETEKRGNGTKRKYYYVPSTPPPPIQSNHLSPIFKQHWCRPYRTVPVGGESQELFERTGDGGKEKQTPNDTERTLKAFPRAGVAGRAVEFDITFHSLESFHRSFHQRFILRL